MATPEEHSRKRRGLLLAGALVVAAALGLASWWTWTSVAIGGITVTSTDEPSCTGTTLGKNGQTIEVNRAMSCVIAVTVRNDGPATLRLDNAELPYLGPRGGPAVRAVEVDGREPESAPGSLGIDAAVPLAHALGPGESWTFRTRITYRPRGCTAPGSFTVSDWPGVQVSYLGRAGVIHGDRDFVIRTRKQNPGCPDS